jgi:polar amino acid transport system permease protein
MKKPSKSALHKSANSLVDRLKSVDRWWLLVIIIVVLVILLIVFKPDPYLRILLFVRDGVWVTLYTTVISFSLVLVIGMIGGLGRISHNRIINGIASTYVEIVRGVPLLVQLIFWYFAFPSLIQDIGDAWNIPTFSTYKANPLVIAILGLTFCYGAYMSEVYRAGIESIPRGQMEAARSLGMNYFQAMWYIILPQAVRMILPSVGNEFVTLLKDSSLISVVAVADLTRRGREFMAANFIPVQTWVMVALLYLILTLIAARVVSWLEKRSSYER